MFFDCSDLTALKDIPTFKCSESFGQIQKIAFQRMRKDDGQPNKFTSSNPIVDLSSWSTLLQASDSTKVVVSPYINNPQQTGGDPITQGGGNDSLDGAEQIIGEQATVLTCVLRGVPQAVAKAMKSLIGQADANDLGVFLINGKGMIEAIQDETDTDTYYPIPLKSLFVGSKMHGGYEAIDFNNMQIAFEPNYSDNLKIIKPNFNAKTQLVK